MKARAMNSLRTRLIAAAVLWIAIGFTIGHWALSSVFRSYATGQFYDELDEHANELERLFQTRPNGDVALASAFSDPRFDEADSGYYWEVREDDDTVLKSPSLQQARLDVPQDKPGVTPPVHRHVAKSPTGKLLLVEKVSHARNGSHPVIRYIVGTDERHLKKMIASFNRVLGATLAIFAAAMIIATIGMVSMTLAPFRRLSKAFQDMRAGVTSRIEGDFPSEVSPIISELNELLDATRDMLQRARSQAGNLAHGLKGPLAVVAEEAFALEQKGQSEASGVITEQCRIMQRHIDHHIARARASAVSKLPGMATNVGEAVAPILSALARVYRDKEVSVETRFAADARVAVDPQDFSEIMGNVLDNAFKFARRRVAVRTDMSRVGETLLIVDDDGPGLPPEARDVVFEIGARWDETKSGGGLGLAIVRELTQLYGGSCRLEESPLGGLRVIIALNSPSS